MFLMHWGFDQGKKQAKEEFVVLENVKNAVRIIEKTPEFAKLIPEISSNIVMALKDAKGINDVIGVPGRIQVIKDKPKAMAEPDFGASTHVASALLTAIDYDNSIRSAINIKFDHEILKICEEMGLIISYYDRKEEPEETKGVDGKTIPWGITQAIKKIGKVPDVVYDEGEVGKEPMIFLFGETAIDVANLIVKIAIEFNRQSIS